MSETSIKWKNLIVVGLLGFFLYKNKGCDIDVIPDPTDDTSSKIASVYDNLQILHRENYSIAIDKIKSGELTEETEFNTFLKNSNAEDINKAFKPLDDAIAKKFQEEWSPEAAIEFYSTVVEELK